MIDSRFFVAQVASLLLVLCGRVVSCGALFFVLDILQRAYAALGVVFVEASSETLFGRVMDVGRQLLGDPFEHLFFRLNLPCR